MSPFEQPSKKIEGASPERREQTTEKVEAAAEQVGAYIDTRSAGTKQPVSILELLSPQGKEALKGVQGSRDVLRERKHKELEAILAAGYKKYNEESGPSSAPQTGDLHDPDAARMERGL